MSKKEKLLLKLLAGFSDANFNIDDLVKILDWFEFEERNIAEVTGYFLRLDV